MVSCHSIQGRQVFGSGQLAQSGCRSSRRIGHRSQTSYRLTRTGLIQIFNACIPILLEGISIPPPTTRRCVGRAAIVRHLNLDRSDRSGCYRQQSRPLRRAASCRMRSQFGRGASLCSQVVLPTRCAASYPSILGHQTDRSWASRNQSQCQSTHVRVGHNCSQTEARQRGCRARGWCSWQPGRERKCLRTLGHSQRGRPNRTPSNCSCNRVDQKSSVPIGYRQRAHEPPRGRTPSAMACRSDRFTTFPNRKIHRRRR